jgi:YHS domain-containing protein
MVEYGSVPSDELPSIELSPIVKSKWEGKYIALLAGLTALLGMISIFMMAGDVGPVQDTGASSANTIDTIKNVFHPKYDMKQLQALKKTTSLVKTRSPLKKVTSAAEYASLRKEQSMGTDNVVYEMCKSYYDDKEAMTTETFNEYCFTYLVENTSGSSCSCNGMTSPFTTAECTDKSIPASGGADFVKYFDVYRYQTTEEGTAGELFNSTYSYVYEGTRFHFESEANKAKFIADPVKYMPAYGGFCAFGISMEYCGFLAWDASCLGPSGGLTNFAYYDDKLYLFYSDSAKDLFEVNPKTAIALGDSRWMGWFGSSVVQSTKCFVVNE